ncbi:BnaC03g23090D [Brassica napus]|uniref:BnaC03g23090D protein n=1 Tax=Brassica napus TaxID=3708 RepID=A0A078GAU3_BRANA|nr:BnaC03g23090D [Brassica napus]
MLCCHIAQWILFWLWELSFQQDFLSFFLAQRFTIGKALWFKVRDWSLRVRDVQCMDELIFLVLEVDCRTVSPRLLTDFGFPCSKGGPQTIQNLTKQFHPSLTEEEKIKKKEGKGLKFFFLEKRFNTQPIKTNIIHVIVVMFFDLLHTPLIIVPKTAIAAATSFSGDVSSTRLGSHEESAKEKC